MSGSTEEPTSTLTSNEELTQQIATGVEAPVSSLQKRKQRIGQPPAGKAVLDSMFLNSSGLNRCTPGKSIEGSADYPAGITSKQE